MKFTSNYFFSILLLFLTATIFAQETKIDTLPVKSDRYGLRVGVDVYRLTRAFYDDNYKGLELVGDFRFSKKIYLAAELGNENYTKQDDRLNFTTKGSYLKAGADYNVYENWLDMENLIYIGFRVGVSTFSQTLNSYTVYTPDPYFGESPTIQSGEEFKGLNAQWGEFVMGIKAELFSNLYAGFSIRFNRLFNNTKPAGFDNLYIPGFNRTYDGNFGVGFNYTVSYFIPIYKVKKVAEKEYK
ncbi:DUF6048 family protein [Flavobacterium orientale]|uniref:Outer membrane protein beta-barrel domain-containing protein n=1 Tax=Flavobacterium orientale TaxID=1756020 RepID=A0A916Y0R2_9FLAO|nr:DUF6048 family protein [Flavobacterium orientale]GGD25133.1 hypothetical protein GCM10011343_14140 [Flavobacterium orientale]